MLLSICMKATTWARDSHGLFDYESKQVYKKHLRTTKDSQIVMTGNDVDLLTESSTTESLEEKKTLAKLKSSETGFELVASEQEPAWLVVRSLNENKRSRGYNLTKGTVLKVGRVTLKVKAIHNLAEETSCIEMPPAKPGSICKVCLTEFEKQEDPLISVCNCSGSMKYIHYNCLQKWVSSRVVTKEGEDSVCYFWKNIDCEICKEPLPLKVSYEGKNYSIFTTNHLDEPFIALEGCFSQNKKGERGIHVIAMTNRCQVKLGRGHESDVRISDISVSRLHAVIKYENGQFVIEDYKSKFGTLVMLDKDKKLHENERFAIQSGRTVIQLSVVPDSFKGYGQDLPWEEISEM